jgi:hypothetical protein
MAKVLAREIIATTLTTWLKILQEKLLHNPGVAVSLLSPSIMVSRDSNEK